MAKTGTRELLVFALALLLAAGVCLADVYLLPGVALPAAPYALPILVAAYFLPPRAVVGVAVWTLALEVWAAARQETPPELWAAYLLGVALFGVLGAVLAARMRREVALAEQLEAERSRLEAVVEQLPAGVIVAEAPSGQLILGNRQVEAIWRRPFAASASVEHYYEYEGFHPDGRPYGPEEWPLARSVQTGEVVVAEEIKFVGGDGARGVMEVSSAPIRDRQGRIVAGVVVFSDVTERKRAEAERKRLLQEVKKLAREAQQRAAELQSVLDNMVEGVFVCDTAGRITLANEASARVFGLATPNEARRTLAELPDLLRIRHPDGQPFAPDELALARALDGRTVEAEDQIIYNSRVGQDVYIRVSAAPIRGEDGQVVAAVSVIRDVTELIELDRLKDQFVAVAAHELKTPVAIMKGCAQVLSRTASDHSEPHRRMLDAIDRGASRIDRLVMDLLDISRLQQGRLELTMDRVDLTELVAEVVDRMALTTNRHRVRVVSAEPVVVQGDRDRLEQVLANLIDNAIRYSPEGGDVDVTVAVRGRGGPHCPPAADGATAPSRPPPELPGVASSGEHEPGGESEAVVAVGDHGVGIPREKQVRMLQPFFRAHTGTPFDYGGMGVGLYISNEIVKRHGGRIWFESEEEGGSTFYFSLPLGEASRE